MPTRVIFGSLACCLLILSEGYAQQPPQPPPKQQPPAANADASTAGQAPIRVQVNEVVVPVTVTDEKGRFVSNLEQKDFTIYDQGRQQSIEYFTRERNQPVVVGFLLDLSNDSRTQWKNWEAAAEEMVLQMLPDQEQQIEKKKFAGYLIGYSDEAHLLVDTTSDPQPILDRLRKLKPGGGAALYDAIYEACSDRKLVQGEPIEPRRVIIVIGDGNDNHSSKTLDQVVEMAQRNLVTIYGLSTLYSGFTNDGQDALERLATETGGRVEYPLADPYKDISGYLSQPRDEGNYAIQPGTGGYASAVSSAIFGSVAAIIGEITTQYILRYIPDVSPQDSARQFRNIVVKVNLPTVKVRARRGYYAYGVN
ncbi:MAG TPA: VWA domain-containing protein [Bryobacteraceae bacterium]|nr:VWA domain-containing protein [Bryobacteraceae bacterium]